VLEIIESSSVQWSASGVEIPGSADENICLKAYRLLKADFDLPPVHIHLHKNIPVGAGLGSGSAHAAWVLKLLNTLFRIGLKSADLSRYAAQLGSDCPFFILNEPAFVHGRGDISEPLALSLEDYFMVLAMPDIHISTAEAFKGVSPG